MNEIKNQSVARLAAIGRKASCDLADGDTFTLLSGETFTFVRWSGSAFPNGQAMGRNAFVRTPENKVTLTRLNMAGSVKMV